MGELLGITGPIGSGKTTFADMLAETTEDHAHYESWYVIAEIATAFNAALKAELEFDTTTSQFELANQVLIWLPDAISEVLHHDVVWNQLAITKHDTLAHPALYEKLFIYMDMVTKDRSLLDKPLNDETKPTFRPLLQWIGGYFIAKISKTIWYDEIIRRIDLRDPTTSLVVIGGVRSPSEADVIRAHGGRIVAMQRQGIDVDNSDPTESRRDAIIPDITVANNGTVDQLRELAVTLADDLAAGKPKKHYSAG